MARASTSPRAEAQASKVDFKLHTLGWEAFQNLCSHVLREVLGQTVASYSPSNDGGQDGTFKGTWRRTANEAYDGAFVVQCKFSALQDEHLSLSHLTDELTKAAILASTGHARTYLLISNAKVTGAAALKIRQAFEKIPKLTHFAILGGEWLTQQILDNKKLRAHVPRIYGLGDLTQILDERVYRQAEEILQSWRDNLGKFVPTDAHHQSVKAIHDDGFVMLLGDPMAGKSTIAAAIALAAADQGCSPVFITQPSQFSDHWNPDEPSQFFWVDDAFGPTQFNSARAQGWSQIFPTLAAAIRKGARVLFTSRTYIYRQALNELKISAFPLINEKRVIIEVEKLSHKEKERILYNHLRMGDQPPEFRRSLKPHLESIAHNRHFLPEIARRLGTCFFTKDLRLDAASLNSFVENPAKLLGDIIAELDRPSYSALALLFMRAGRIEIPVSMLPDEEEALRLLGVKLSQVRDACHALEGTLVTSAIEHGCRYWKFRHPSIRDAIGASVAAQPDLIDIYLSGAKADDIVAEVVCGEVSFQGAKVHIPVNRYDRLLEKLQTLDLNNTWLQYGFVSFLRTRCPSSFVCRWKQRHPEQFEALFCKALGRYEFSSVLATLKKADMLEENFRIRYVEDAEKSMVESAEGSFLEDDFDVLISPHEVDRIISRVKSELLPRLTGEIIAHEDCFDPSHDDPEDHFTDWRNNLQAFEDLHDDEEIIDAFREALALIDDAEDRLSSKKERHEEKEKAKKEERADLEEFDDYWDSLVDSYGLPKQSQNAQVAQMHALSIPLPPRSIFDDVDL